MNKFEIQEKQYDFPYHHIPHWGKRGEPQLSRVLTWGWEYLTYMTQVVDLISEVRPKSLLDVGCGDGRLIAMVGKSVPKRVGIDLSERAITLARGMVPEGEFWVKDIQSLEGTFDCVTAVEVLEHIPDQGIASFVASLAERTRPGGFLIVSTPTRVTPTHRKHYRHYDRALLLDHLAIEKNGLSVVREVYVYRETFLSRAVRAWVVNSVWTLTSGRLLRLFWNMHLRRYYRADASDGFHLILLLRTNPPL